MPELGAPIALWPPHTEHNLSDAGMLIFAGREPVGFGKTGFAAVLVAPATGKVLGVVDVDRSPAYAPLCFHRNFWGGNVGSIVVGVMAVGCLFLLVAGLYLWWPAPKRLGRKLSGRPLRLSLTRARPMHDWIGVSTVPILAIVTFTGLYIAQPSSLQPAIDAVAADPPERTPIASDGACASPITLDEAVARGRTLAGASAFRSIYPGGRENVWEITFGGGDSEALHRETHAVAGLSCGTVMVEATPETRTSAEAATLWLYGLHDGTAFGTAGPALVSLAGLPPIVLMISGLRLWLLSRRSRVRVVARHSSSQLAVRAIDAELISRSR